MAMKIETMLYALAITAISIWAYFEIVICETITGVL